MLSRHRPHPAKNPQKVTTPDLTDLLLRIPPAHQLPRDVGSLTLIVESNNPRTVIEVRTDTDVIHTDALDQIVDMINVVAQSRLRQQVTEFPQKGFQLIRRQRVDAFLGADRPVSGAGR